jgi:hypothetical protein
MTKARTQFVQREIGLRLRVKVAILSIRLDVDHIVDGDTGLVTARQMDCHVQLLHNIGDDLSNSVPSIEIVNVRIRGLKGLIP